MAPAAIWRRRYWSSRRGRSRARHGDRGAVSFGETALNSRKLELREPRGAIKENKTGAGALGDSGHAFRPLLRDDAGGVELCGRRAGAADYRSIACARVGGRGLCERL